MQSHHIQIPRSTGIVGNMGHGRVVSRPIGRPLPMQSLLCPQNTSVLDIRLRRTLPTTLPGPLHVSQGSVTRSYKRMISTLTKMPANEQRRVLTEVRAKLADDSLRPCGPAFLTSPCHAWMLPNNNHQRAPQEAAPTHVPAPEGQQRVNPTPEVTPADSLQRMSNTLPIMNAPNPTTRRVLKSTKRAHLRLTRNSVPGTVPPITRTQPLYSPPTATKMTPIR
jgi:hypothetical protein